MLVGVLGVVVGGILILLGFLEVYNSSLDLSINLIFLVASLIIRFCAVSSYTNF
jgi:hypothetical protein